ncbi:MAG TPA: hypothetical protein VL992_00495 [Tepidisphaeraceae bacterium]|nr:hypothetical protein [Tepidisphaeraceae bacterium]
MNEIYDNREGAADAERLAFRHEMVRRYINTFANYRERFGEVRPIAHAYRNGKKIVAIGKSLMASDQWRTFTDFLIAYAISVFGDAWGQAEQRKDPTLRHPVVRWYDRLYASVSAGHKSDDKNVSVWYRPTALRWRFFIWPMTYTCLLIMNPFRRNLSRG